MSHLVLMTSLGLFSVCDRGLVKKIQPVVRKTSFSLISCPLIDLQARLSYFLLTHFQSLLWMWHVLHCVNPVHVDAINVIYFGRHIHCSFVALANALSALVVST